jgi:uncharacterized protein
MDPKNIPGRFVHFDLMTNDLEAALAFYSQLFGWTVNEVDMGEYGAYTMVADRVRPFGGMVQLDSAAGIPSHWIPYISCLDVDNACAIATDLGATIQVPPTDIEGGHGRFAMLLDPQGALFAPYFHEAATGYDSTIDVGSVEWVELSTSDPDAAIAFYRRVFGWETREMQMGSPEVGPYTVLRSDGMDVGGIMEKPADMPVSAWMLYFRVANLDQAVADAQRLGGSPLFPPFEVDEIGRIVWATDVTGAVFSMIEPSFVAVS